RRTANAFDFQANSADRAEKVLPERLVPDQRFLGVVQSDVSGLVQKDAVVQPGAGVTGQILAVGVRAENQTAAVKAGTFARIGKESLFPGRFVADEAER